MVFGRKISDVSESRNLGKLQHPGPDDDGVSRVIPKSVWAGQAGDYLKNIGRTPDDPDNLLVTPEILQARHDAKFAQLNRLVDELNRTAPAGVRVAPYAMLPWSSWHGKRARFLSVSLEMYPTQPWNTMLLAETERCSILMDLPVHPGGYPKQLIDGVDKALDDFSSDFNLAAGKAGQMLALPNWMDSMGEFSIEKNRIRDKVMHLAHQFAIITFGQDVYDRHTKMFGAQLGWNSVQL
jgi:hypothetical protein